MARVSRLQAARAPKAPATASRTGSEHGPGHWLHFIKVPTISPMQIRLFRLRYRHRLIRALGALGLILLLAIWAFDWNWLRHPLERYVTSKTQREFRIDDLHVALGLTPVMRMRNVYFQNAAWSKQQPMAAIGELTFSVSLAELWNNRIVIPELGISDAHVALERTGDGRKNWLLSDPNDRSPSILRIRTLRIHGGAVSYSDQGSHFQVTATDVGLNAPGLLHSSDPRYETRLQFKGTYREAPFSGEVLTSSLLSFQQTDESFPLLGHLDAGHTKLDVSGGISNLVELSAIDAQIKIQGATLANLYPFLLLPLPASPPYSIEGRLNFKDTTYRLQSFHGKIGSTDIAGDATYLNQRPRPMLRLTVSSKQMNLDDLGPLLGIQTASGSGQPTVRAALGSREQAAASEHAGNTEHAGSTDPDGNQNGDRILPIGAIDPERMRVLDADVSFKAEKLIAPTVFPVDSLEFHLGLDNALLHIDPVDFGFGGGHLIGHIVLDARTSPINAQADVEARAVDMSRLIPSGPRVAPSGGRIGGRVLLKGKGNSIAAVMADSSGYARLAISGGRISNLADAAVGLNGGKVLGLLVTGDKTIAIRCGALDFEFANGLGQSKVFLLDTEQTEVQGTGKVDLRGERFDLSLSPEPKDAGILSLRAPIRIYGTFKHVDYSINKGIVAAHVGSAIALGILNPLAALVPLLETGPGEDANCQNLLGQSAAASSTPKQ